MKIPYPFWTNFPMATGAALGYDPAMLSAPVLSLRGITKVFPGVRANDRVDLEIHRGEVHALVGENGAGKSTLMKILYGFYRADAGEIRFDGHPTEIREPEDARRLGIGMVFQDFVQIPALSVAENLALFFPNLAFILDRGEIVRRIETTSRRYGLDVDPSAPVWRLSIGERQKVEVLKLLLADAQVLILDEPTRSLASHEIEALFRTFDGLRRDGFAVVFITHKLQDVLACADRITVMRRGRVAGTLPRAGATESALVSMMFGDVVAEAKPALPRGQPHSAKTAITRRVNRFTLPSISTDAAPPIPANRRPRERGSPECQHTRRRGGRGLGSGRSHDRAG